MVLSEDRNQLLRTELDNSAEILENFYPESLSYYYSRQKILRLVRSITERAFTKQLPLLNKLEEEKLPRRLSSEELYNNISAQLKKDNLNPF